MYIYTYICIYIYIYIYILTGLCAIALSHFPTKLEEDTKIMNESTSTLSKVYIHSYHCFCVCV